MFLKKYDPEEKRLMISPSVLSADFSRLKEEVLPISKESELLHVDVMDGHFVPNISFGFPVIKALKEFSAAPLDVHLMISRADVYLEAFRDAGADILSVHAEACTHLHRTIMQIKELGMSAGVVLNPSSPLISIEEILPYIDLVLIMSVNPGYGGQTYIPTMTDKIRRLRKMLDDKNPSAHIEVDGGVSASNAGEIAEAGASILVAGTSIFKSPDPIAEIRKLRNCRL